ncbi:MAG: response regulator transcription factor [Elusimicrobia bacterium]|nr:response regulator transcription factor [Elusimicrobiota bacterium]
MVNQKFRLILVDDHPAMRESIAAAVADFYPRRLDVVAQCGDGLSAVEQAKKHGPDLVLLDLGLPGKNGLQALAEICSACPATRLIVFSMHDDQAHVVDAIRAGADDYLFKGQMGAKEVVDHVAHWLERESEKPDRVRGHVFSALRGLAVDRVARGLPSLTETEIRVLGLAGFRGLSMKEIAKELSGSERTIRKHLENTYEKLGARNQAHAVCLAIKLGILSAESAELEEENG